MSRRWPLLPVSRAAAAAERRAWTDLARSVAENARARRAARALPAPTPPVSGAAPVAALSDAGRAALRREREGAQASAALALAERQLRAARATLAAVQARSSGLSRLHEVWQDDLRLAAARRDESDLDGRPCALGPISPRAAPGRRRLSEARAARSPARSGW